MWNLVNKWIKTDTMSEEEKVEAEGASLKQVSSLLACAIPSAYVNLLFEVRVSWISNITLTTSVKHLMLWFSPYKALEGNMYWIVSVEYSTSHLKPWPWRNVIIIIQLSGEHRRRRWLCGGDRGAAAVEALQVVPRAAGKVDRSSLQVNRLLRHPLRLVEIISIGKYMYVLK